MDRKGGKGVALIRQEAARKGEETEAIIQYQYTRNKNGVISKNNVTTTKILLVSFLKFF